MTKPDLPLALVVWNDAHVEADLPVTLDTVADTHKPTVIHTLGWVIREDEVGISLVNEFYEYTYRGRTFIPKAMVESITYLKLVKQRAKPEPT